MEPVLFKFKLKAEDYRKMSYFNTFSLKRMQMFLIIFFWCGSVLLLGMELLSMIHPTEIMHLCFIIVALAVPVMVLAVEMNVRRFQRSIQKSNSEIRTVTLNEQGVKPSSDGGYGAPTEPWKSFVAVYETKSMFILYKDVNHTIIIPKEGEPPEKLAAARSYFEKNLSGHFKKRISM